MLPEQSKFAWSIIVSLLHFVAISSTIFRLCHRIRNKQLWWDDYVTIIPLLLDFVSISVLWRSLSSGDYLRYPGGGSSSVFTSFFLGFILNLTILWFARISLALALARLFPPGHLARILSLFLSGLYLSFFFAMSGLVIGLCQGENLPWYNIDPNNCRGRTQQIPIPGLFGILFDFVADLLLFILPILMLRRVRLPGTERRIILAALSASILTLLSTIIFAIFWYSHLPLGPDVILLRIVVTQIETTTSLIVCNILMVTMFFYRIFRRIPGSSPIEKPKVPCPTPPPPPRSPTPEEPKDTEKEVTENITDQPAQLILTEIEEFPEEPIQYSHFDDNGVALQTESAPVAGQRSFSLQSCDFVYSLPPGVGGGKST